MCWLTWIVYSINYRHRLSRARSRSIKSIIANCNFSHPCVLLSTAHAIACARPSVKILNFNSFNCEKYHILAWNVCYRQRERNSCMAISSVVSTSWSWAVMGESERWKQIIEPDRYEWNANTQPLAPARVLQRSWIVKLAEGVRGRRTYKLGRVDGLWESWHFTAQRSENRFSLWRATTTPRKVDEKFLSTSWQLDVWHFHISLCRVDILALIKFGHICML